MEATVKLSQIIDVWESFSGWYWFVTEQHSDGLAFGLVRGHETEWGYFSLDELEDLRERHKVWRVEKRNWAYCPCVIDDAAETKQRLGRPDATTTIAIFEDALRFLDAHGMGLQTDGHLYTALVCPRGRFVFEDGLTEEEVLSLVKDLEHEFADMSEKELWGHSEVSGDEETSGDEHLKGGVHEHEQ